MDKPKVQTTVVHHAQPQVHVVHHDPFHSHSVVMHQPTTQTQTMSSNERCPKCRGNGFVHLSNMTHKKPTMNQKCFFCEDCTACKGNGFIKGSKTVTTSVDIFGNVHNVSSQSSVQPCFKCKGNGFVHLSNMTHKKPTMNQKCFFCEDCKACKGTGRMQ